MPTLQGQVATSTSTVNPGGLVLAAGAGSGQAELWPLPINWRAGWGESYEFSTEVLVSRNQHEQRRALRKNPRAAHEFLATAIGGTAGERLRQRLAARESKQWVVPHGRVTTTLSAAISAGGTAFTLSTDPAWMAAGVEVVLRGPEGTELAEISTYGAGSGTFTSAVLQDMPAGTFVHLGVRGRLGGSSRLNLATVRHGEMNVRFEAEPGGHYVPPGGSSNETYNGKEVWAVAPNWAGGVSLAYEASQDVIDFGFGVLGYLDPVDYVARTIQAEFHVKTQAEYDAIYGLFLRSRGKRTDFYMPAWNKELSPKTLTTTEMVFDGTEISSLLGADPSHRHVAFFKKDGARLYREIDVFAASGSESILKFREALPALTLDDLHYVTWLMPTRFFSDRLQLDYVTNTAATVSLSFLTLRDES